MGGKLQLAVVDILYIVSFFNIKIIILKRNNERSNIFLTLAYREHDYEVTYAKRTGGRRIV